MDFNRESFEINKAIHGREKAMIMLEQDLIKIRHATLAKAKELIVYLFELSVDDVLEMFSNHSSAIATTGYSSNILNKPYDIINDLRELLGDYLDIICYLNGEYNIFTETEDFFELIRKNKDFLEKATIHINSLTIENWMLPEFEAEEHTPQAINGYIVSLANTTESLSELFDSYLNYFSHHRETNPPINQSVSLDKQQKGKSFTKTSYHWQGSPDEVTDLYRKMIAGNLIAKDTAEADFKAIFEAKPVDDIKPIRWMQTKVLLAYFVYKLSRSNNKISVSDNHWKIAESCFELAKNLRQAWRNCQEYNNENKPKNHHLVDELF